MTVAQALRRPLWSLLKKIFSEEIDQEASWPKEFENTWQSMIVKAIEDAKPIGAAGELEIVDRKKNHIEFVSIHVSQASGRAWWVDIHYKHVENREFNFDDLKVGAHIKFKFSEEAIISDLTKPSCRLIIEYIVK